ncbi:ABC transporter ATP-binding protein [Oscillospiraceae bacterium MB08-C2-2]|nr:ABC transporter ATP-binding protein [Oscillospiraceae bacterium MB08-C2-2]
MELKGVDKSFGGVHAINDLSFSVYEGEILGLIGPNGCGKSTSVNLMTGVYTHDKGEIIYYDAKGEAVGLKAQSVPDRAKLGIGRTFQTPKPFTDLTVFENIYTIAMLYTHSLKEAHKVAEEIVHFVQFDDISDQKCTKLPIEKRKWLDMARVLAMRPRILMLDECLAGLTPSEMETSLEMVRKINQQGITVLFIEHVMSAVTKLCSRVVVMEEGHFMTEGCPLEVMKKPEVIRAYLGEDYQ